MSVEWRNQILSDEELERMCQHAEQQKADPPKKDHIGYLVMSWFLFWSLVCGVVWYGLVRLLAAALRALGVHISGI
jgi:hypothetical protein